MNQITPNIRAKSLSPFPLALRSVRPSWLVAVLWAIPATLYAQDLGDAARPAMLRVESSSRTGLTTMLSSQSGDAISVVAPLGLKEAIPEDFVDQYGAQFGVTNQRRQLRREAVATDALGFTHTTFQQVHREIPVFGGVLRVHQNSAGGVMVANGQIFPVKPNLSTIPTAHRSLALQLCHAAMPQSANQQELQVERAELVIVDPGWYGDPGRGERLAWHIVLRSIDGLQREAFFVDAHSSEILDRWSMIHHARNRQVSDGQAGDFLPGVLARSEADPPVLAPVDVNTAYDYSGDTYDFYFRGFGRDSYDDLGSPLLSTVNSNAPNCPNAFWDGERMVYCLGTVVDDVVAHELTHGVTEYTSGLIYQNQPGQLNESMSDVFGELVDLFNGDVAFVGAPAAPFWPAHATGSGLDLPNTARTGCSNGLFVEVNSPGDIARQYPAAAAVFGATVTTTGLTEDIAAAAPSTACNTNLPLNDAQIAGRIVLVDRGVCTFAEKATNAQNAGAVGVIVINNVPGPPFSMSGAGPITIPVVMLSQSDGNLIRDRLSTANVNATLRSLPLNVDGVRWLVGEDATAFGGSIRDMFDPTCRFDPDDANHPFQTCVASDSGGVHTGSGVPNHAFALVVDGGNFNDRTVVGIGPIKAGAVWYRAQTIYLTPFSGFREAFAALLQSAIDLIGTTPNDPRTGEPSPSVFSAFDAQQVEEALLAVEMNTDGACGAVLDGTPPVLCADQIMIYSDDFESGDNGWTVENFVNLTPYDWVQSASLPLGRLGIAWYVDDPDIGDCGDIDESGIHSLMSPVIAIPSAVDDVQLAFTHYFETEAGYDGGNISINVDGAGWTLLPRLAISYNPYPSSLAAAPANTSPLAGLPAWHGPSATWGTSVIVLREFVSGGELVQFRFDFGKDGCTGFIGWFIDDLAIFDCIDCNGNNIPDSTEADCQPNGRPDDCDITFLHSADCNGNLLPDECEFSTLYGDIAPPGGNGIVDLDDLVCSLSGFSDFSTCPPADIFPCIPNGVIDVDDLIAVLIAYAGNPPVCTGPCD